MTSTPGKLMSAKERKPLHLKEAPQPCTQLLPSRQTNFHATSPFCKTDLTRQLKDTEVQANGYCLA